jgi:hypothetical protein
MDLTFVRLCYVTVFVLFFSYITYPVVKRNQYYTRRLIKLSVDLHILAYAYFMIYTAGRIFKG